MYFLFSERSIAPSKETTDNFCALCSILAFTSSKLLETSPLSLFSCNVFFSLSPMSGKIFPIISEASIIDKRLPNLFKLSNGIIINLKRRIKFNPIKVINKNSLVLFPNRPKYSRPETKI